MSTDEFKQVVDYYVATTGNSPIIIAAVAVAISLISVGISIYTFHRQHAETVYGYLAGVWNDLLNDCLVYPNFLDVTQTEHYYRLLSREEAVRYEVYSYKAWGHVEDIIAKGYEKDGQFEPVIRWVAAYHYTWLTRNPTFFTMESFWKKVEDMRNVPNMIHGYRHLPAKDGDIDWDVVSEDYHTYILSPFALEMTMADNQGRTRNLLLNYLNKEIPKEDLRAMEVADFGCGPGSLIPHIAGKIHKLIGVDKSEGALKVACAVAEKYGVPFESVQCDILALDESRKYDLIVSANSVLPPKRVDVVRLLRKMRNCLKPFGRFVAILPSFDTTEYLRELWKDHYKALTNSDAHAERVVEAFDETKKVNRETLSYADDGKNIQCYHNLESIPREFEEAALRLVRTPEKLYYPWDLTKRFDYGYFPHAKEEIWDWFVVAERKESSR